MDSIEFLEKNDLSNTKVTMIYTDSWMEESDEFYCLTIKGKYVKDEYKYFEILIGCIPVNSPDLKERFESLKTVKNPVLKGVLATRKEKDYHVKMVVENNGSETGLEFTCRHFSASGVHYFGFDYTNVYGTPEYLEMLEKYRYVFDEQYFCEEDILYMRGHIFIGRSMRYMRAVRSVNCVRTKSAFIPTVPATIIILRIRNLSYTRTDTVTILFTLICMGSAISMWIHWRYITTFRVAMIINTVRLTVNPLS